MGDPAATSVSIWCAALLAAMLAIAVSLLLLIAAGSGAAAPGARALGEPTVLLPVWATIDGDTPVSGGSVRVLGSGGSALEQVSPTEATTGPQGPALLEFSELPSAFTVVVSGGKARGKRLRGDLRADVRNYRPSGVVHVSPVTTMIAQDIRARRRRGDKATVGTATRGIERLLRIPPHQNAIDLRRSDEFFDGDTFLERAGGAGVPALIDELVRTELRSGDPARRFVPDGGERGAPAQPRAPTLQPRKLTVPGPVITVLKALSETAVGRLSDYILLPPELKKVLIGWLMSGWSKVLGADELGNPDMAKIRDLLGKIDEKLTEVEASVAQVKLDVLIAQTNDTLGKIDSASEKLSFLANTKRGNAETELEFATRKRNFAETIGASVERGNLDDAPAILHKHLFASGPLAEGILKAASQAVSKRGRFFDASDSASVESVFNYYALYQAQLATLLTNYWHTKPDTFTGEYIKGQVAKIEANIAAQAELLKPAVPDGAVIDTRTNKMWTQDFRPNPQDANEFYKRVLKRPGPGAYTEYPQGAHGPRTLGGLPGGNWTLPSKAEIETLIQGRGNVNGPHWLHDKARMNLNQTNAAGGLAYMSGRDGWKEETKPKAVFDHRLEIFRYNLWTGGVVPEQINWCNNPDEGCHKQLRSQLQNVKGAIFYVRPVGGDGPYWWG